MTIWTWLWLGWGAYFALVEGMALANSKPGGTLSEHVWAFLGYSGGVKKPTAWTYLRRFLVLAFLAWLSAHLLTGGKF